MNESDVKFRLAADTMPLKNGLNEVTALISKMDTAFDKSFKNMGTNFTRNFTQVATSDAKRVSNVFGNVLQSIEKSILNNFLGSLKNSAAKDASGLGGIVTGIFSGGLVNSLVKGLLGGGKATGGNVAGGSPVLVGERGPELFVPFSGGKVVPNQQVGGGQGGAINIQMTVVTPDASSFRASQGQILSEAALAMSRARRNL